MQTKSLESTGFFHLHLSATVWQIHWMFPWLVALCLYVPRSWDRHQEGPIKREKRKPAQTQAGVATHFATKHTCCVVWTLFGMQKLPILAVLTGGNRTLYSGRPFCRVKNTCFQAIFAHTALVPGKHSWKAGCQLQGGKDRNIEAETSNSQHAFCQEKCAKSNSQLHHAEACFFPSLYFPTVLAFYSPYLDRCFPFRVFLSFSFRLQARNSFGRWMRISKVFWPEI